MAKRFCFLFLLLTTVFSLSAQREVYVSTSFHEPATDGLRFIYSYDGWHWDSIPGTWLKPEVGKQRVMRDPSIIRTPDGTFHLVWTSSWRGDRGFGYACSKDLKHWSDQRFIEVMTDTATVNVWAPELFWDDERQQAVRAYPVSSLTDRRNTRTTIACILLQRRISRPLPPRS